MVILVLESQCYVKFYTRYHPSKFEKIYDLRSKVRNLPLDCIALVEDWVSIDALVEDCVSVDSFDFLSLCISASTVMNPSIDSDRSTLRSFSEYRILLSSIEEILIEI